MTADAYTEPVGCAHAVARFIERYNCFHRHSSCETRFPVNYEVLARAEPAIEAAHRADGALTPLGCTTRSSLQKPQFSRGG